MDFIRICTKEVRGSKTGEVEVFADFQVGRSKSLMVRGNAFYAIYDPETGLWSTDPFDVRRLVDEEIRKVTEKLEAGGTPCKPKYLASYSNGRWDNFQKWLKNVPDHSQSLDMKVTFANTPVKQTDYISRRLPYALEAGPTPVYDELVSRLYSPEQREKFEWAIGAVLHGDAKKIQKFIVFYGDPGTGKSTIMDIIAMMLGGKQEDGGYIAYFNAQEIVGTGSFALSSFKGNPLVAIQHDVNLSNIPDNSRLNSIVSHEDMEVNEKFKTPYNTKINAFLFVGTNEPVQISDAKSGLIRRLIDVHPTGKTFEAEHYHSLIERVPFELGAIAHRCMEVYKRLGRSYYTGYKPIEMLYKTNPFFNFLSHNIDQISDPEGISLRRAYDLYKEYATMAELKYKMSLHKFREELKNYFEEFKERHQTPDGINVRSYFLGFKHEKMQTPVAPQKTDTVKRSLVIEDTESLLDAVLADQPAQYHRVNPLGAKVPAKFWTDTERIGKDGNPYTPRPDQVCDTTLRDLDTRLLHFVRVPENHIVIDFDLKDETGAKSLALNLEAASKFPDTYAEISQGGNGVHLHYYYTGDVPDLAPVYEEGIEVKTLLGESSLRRKFTKSRNIPIAKISTGLPIREKKVFDVKAAMTERSLRKLIIENLQKMHCPGTKPSIDFIDHLLNQATNQGLRYDVTDLRPQIMAFALQSRNQATYCLRVVKNMKFVNEGKTPTDVPDTFKSESELSKQRLVFLDTEVYPNLFLVCYSYEDSDAVIPMINPSPADIELLLKMPFIGFNNRKYDNHMLWACYMGYSVPQLYELSQKLIANDPNAYFLDAYNISYADAYDMSVVKMGLKKHQIRLNIPHIEMNHPWSEPLPPEKMKAVIEYCGNDVLSLKKVWKDLQSDWAARMALADLSGLTGNHTTRQHTERIIFGQEREPQKKFIYTNLGEKLFPGYQFDPYAADKSTYRGEVVGEGGYVYAEKGMYENVAVLDVASMHPTSLVQLNYFGPYTSRFEELMKTRLAIKHLVQAIGNKDLVAVNWLRTEISLRLDGKFKDLVTNLNWDDADPSVGEEIVKRLTAVEQALKLIINSIYGLTAATFPNKFRDPRNKDNIVAKRGALFMIDLKHFVQELGYQVVHIKTDSIKIPNANPEIIQKIKDFGNDYGYEFEHEATYRKMTLVNDAVYIARVGWTAKKGDVDYWSATGAQFQHPYVFKTLFTHEDIRFADLCETKQVTGDSAIYMSTNTTPEKPEDISTLRFIGKTGQFVPVMEETHGQRLFRVKDGKVYAVTGTKNHRWLECDTVLEFNKIDPAFWTLDAMTEADMYHIDMRHFANLRTAAIEAIEEYGDFKEFVS